MPRSTSSVNRWATITPSDSTNISGGVPIAIACEGDGNAVLVDYRGATMTLAMTAGQVYPFTPVRINSTNTTATGLKALYNEG